MTDDELISLLENKLPQELTPAEVAIFRARMSESAEIRNALRDRLLIDHSLNQVLGEIRLDPAAILAGRSRGGRSKVLHWLPWIVAPLLVFAVGWMGKVWLIDPALDPRPIGQAKDSLPPVMPVEEQPPRFDAEENSAQDRKVGGASGTGKPVELDATIRPGWYVIPADRYTHGMNVRVAGVGMPAYVEPIPNQYAYYVEYAFDAPAPGSYYLELQYRNPRSTGLAINLNDRSMDFLAATTSVPTLPTDALQGWIRMSQVLPLQAGQNTLRFYSSGRRSFRAMQSFPDLVRIAIQTTKEVAANDLAAADASQPWSDSIQLGAEPRPLAELVREHHRNWGPQVAKSEIRGWFDHARSEFRVETASRNEGTFCTFVGAARLKAPLDPASLLRVAVADTKNDFRLYLWNGLAGYAVCFHEWDRATWAAYRIERHKLTDLKPATYELAATDDGCYARSHSSETPQRVELRCDGKSIFLTHLGLPLIRIPWSGAKPEIVFDGRGVLYGLSVRRITDPGPTNWSVAPPISRAWKPAESEWNVSTVVAPMTLNKRLDGAVELKSDGRNEKPGWATLPLELRGPSLIECEVEILEPGAKLILSGDDNVPRYALCAMRDRRTERPLWQFGSPYDENWESEADVVERLAPYSGRRVWLRLVQGAGFVRAWISLDGENWGKACEPRFDVEGFATRIGLMIPKSDLPRGLILHKIVVRELPLIRDSVSTELASQVPNWKPSKPFATVADWESWTASVRPETVDSKQWNRACMIKALANGLSTQTGSALQDRLFEDVLSQIPADANGLDARLAWLRELSWIADSRRLESNLPSGDRYATRYLELAKAAGIHGEPQAWSKVWPQFVQATSTDVQPYSAEWSLPARKELLGAIYSGDAAKARAAAITMQPIYPRMELLGWTDFWLATRHPEFRLPSGRDDDRQPRVDRRHPLVEQISKESYGTMAELSSALGSKAYRDAGRIITETAVGESGGLLPDENDPQLLVSLPAAVDLAMRNDPELRSTLIREFGEVGLLRFRRAELEADAAVMRILSAQYPGTPAAGLAHAWLGRRALSGGDFDAAFSRFTSALSLATPDLVAELEAYRRMAAALAGREFGVPVKDSVSWGESRISGEEFENLVRDLLKERGRTGLPPAETIPAVLPRLNAISIKELTKTTGDAGEKAGEFPEAINAALEGGKRLDWAASQMAFAPAGELMIWTNRYQVSAYRRDNGELVWKRSLDNDHGKTHDWMMIPARPLVAGEKVFVRRFSRSGPELVALEIKNQGKITWRTSPGTVVIADPLAIDGEIRVLCLQRGDQESQVVLTGYDPHDGTTTFQQPLFSVRAGWDEHRTAQWMTSGDRIYGILTGFVFCCDTRGTISWARRQIWFAPREDRDWPRQSMQPPVLAGDRLYVAQPGVKAIEALDATTGRLIWRQVLPNLRRILVVKDAIVLVETDEDIIGLRQLDGEPSWSSPQSRSLNAYAIDERTPRIVLAREALPSDPKSKSRTVELVELNTDDGSTVQTRSFPEIQGESPQVGPLVPIGERRWWLPFAGSVKEPHRKIMTLGE